MAYEENIQLSTLNSKIYVQGGGKHFQIPYMDSNH